MKNIVKPREYNLATERGLIRACPFMEGGGSLTREVAKRTFPTMVNSPTWGLSSYGPALNMVGASDQYVDLNLVTELSGVQHMTALLLARRTGTYLSAGSTNPSFLDGWGFLFEGSIIYFSLPGASAGYIVVPGVDDKWHRFALVYDGTLTGNTERCKVYIDGVQINPSSDGGTIQSTMTTAILPTRLGRYGTYTLRPTTGGFADFQLYDRSFTSADVFEDSMDPFRIYRNPLDEGWLKLLPAKVGPYAVTPFHSNPFQIGAYR